MNTASEVCTVFLPELLEGPQVLDEPSIQNTKWMICGHRVLEEMATQRHEKLSLVLSAQAFEGLQYEWD